MSTSVLTFPLPSLFSFDGSYWNKVWKGEAGGGRVLISHSCSFFTKIPHHAIFFIAFPNSGFCFQKQQQQQQKKKIAHLFGSHLPLHKRMISRIPNIQGKNPPSRLNFQNVFWSLQKDPLKGKWSPAKSCFKQNYFHVCLLRKFTNLRFSESRTLFWSTIPLIIIINNKYKTCLAHIQ